MPRPPNLAPPLRSGDVSSSGYVKKKTGETKAPPHPLPPLGGGGGVGEHLGCPGDAVEQIKQAALNLDPAARRKLLAELSLANTEADLGETRDLDMWAGAVYDGLAALNGGSGGGLPGPAIVKRALSASGAWSIVRGFMSDAKLDTLSVQERLSVYRMLADLLVRHAHGISMRSAAPLSPKLVANCSTNISSIFDKAFPGYVKAGLAPIVARQLTRTN